MNNLEYDAQTVMEQIHMAESRHMQMGALCSYLLQYPDMTIRNFFEMAAKEIHEEEEESWGITNDGIHFNSHSHL